MQRRLAAILAADVVGYSRLMGVDEEGTLAALKATRQEIVEPLLKQHGGRLFKLMGDGALAEFASVVDAVAFAIAVQRAMAARGDALAQAPRFSYRIGIHAGDVIVDGDDLYGDCVNIAARLEALAEPGGICVSADVYRQARGRTMLEFDSLGPRILKNINEPVEVYASRAAEPGGATPRSGQTAAEALFDRPSVAVLPFAVPAGDGDEAYLGQGLTEEIITTLAYWRRFPVIAPNSVLGRGSMTPAQVFRELHARYVVDGSLRRAGGRLRLTVRLTDASLGEQLWAQRYDRDLGDVFEMQDEIAQAIVASIEPQLSRAEQQRALRKRPDRLDAWDRCLRALWHLRRPEAGARAAAFGELEEALRLDPTSSYAHSLIALAHFLQALQGWQEDPAGSFRQTLAAAQRAVELDEVDWLSHALLGIALLWSRRDYEAAIAAVERAFELNPSAAIARQFYGCVLTFADRPADAIPHLRAVLALDPRYQSPSMILADLALCHLLLGERQRALELAERAVAADSRNPRGHHKLVAALAALGRREDAARALAQLRTLQPSFGRRYIEATYPFRDPAHATLWLDAFRHAGWADEAS